MVQKELWNKLKQRLKEVSIAAADFTEEQALIGKLKFEILTLKRKVDKLHSNLGVHICEMSKINPQPQAFEDADVIHYISEIGDLEKQIEAKRSEITEVADHFRTKSAESKSPDTSTDTTDIPPYTPPFEPPVEPEPPVEAEEKAKKAKPEETPKKKPRKPRKAATKKKTTTAKKTTATKKAAPKKPKGRPPKEKTTK